MRDDSGEVIALQGLCGPMSGNGVSLGDTNAMYFATDTEGEAAGLLGSLRYAG